MTFEKKILELETQKWTMIDVQTKLQEDKKSAILEALLNDDFDEVSALTQELKTQQNGQIVSIDEKIKFLKGRQQNIRNLPEKDEIYRESLLKDDALYMHAWENDDKHTVELFLQRKISEELYQELMDTYYGEYFDAWKHKEWTHINKKLASDQDIGDILKEMNIWYNPERVEEFYEPENLEWCKNPTNKPSKQVSFIKEWNIIQELLLYVKWHNIAFETSDIVLNRKGTTMYIYIQWIDKTVVISNVYGVWTHIYQGKIDIREMQSKTIRILCNTYAGKKINFGLDIWWMEWWKCRLVKTLAAQDNHIEKIQETTSIEETDIVAEEKQDEQNTPTTTKRFGSLREKAEDFAAKKESIKHKNLNFEEQYEWMVTSIGPKDNMPWWRVYINIWKDIFGYYTYKHPEEIKNIRLWDIVNVKAKRIWLKGQAIMFRRPE